jgi:serine/threonine protein kinase
VYRRHFIDAVVTDALMAASSSSSLASAHKQFRPQSQSPSESFHPQTQSHVVNIYGYCAHATINEYASITLNNFIKQHNKKHKVREVVPGGENKSKRITQLMLTPMQRLHYASGVATAIAQLHAMDGGSAVHKDLKPDNIMLAERMEMKAETTPSEASNNNSTAIQRSSLPLLHVKVSDFNDAELLQRNTSAAADGSPCQFRRPRWVSNVSKARQTQRLHFLEGQFMRYYPC